MAIEYRHYRALFQGDDANGWGVVFPDLPGCVSAGDTRAEALTGAVQALECHLRKMIDDGEPLPEPSALADPLPDWLPGDYDCYMIDIGAAITLHE